MTYMRSVLILLVASTTFAQTQSVELYITGKVQSTQTTKRNFGRLPRGYRAADWTVTNESAQPIKVALARLIQEVSTAPGVSILSATSATSVVQDAQGSNPLNTVARVGTGVVSGIAVGQGLKIIPTGGSWPLAILGAEVGTLFVQYVFPTLQTHALQSITAMMPTMLSLDAFGTEPGMVIVELARYTPDPPELQTCVAGVCKPGITVIIPYQVTPQQTPVLVAPAQQAIKP